MILPRLLVLVAAASLVVACGRRSEVQATSDSPRRKAVKTSDAAPSPCAEDNRQIYVVSMEGRLYRFPPLTKTFTEIGRVSCPGSSGIPFSMAVDRTGVAWVLYADGALFEVSTRDASCVATSYIAGQRGVTAFGMAFVTDGPASEHETLYVADDSGLPRGVGVLDPVTLSLGPLVPYDGPAGRFDLTGTGDGRLFGFDGTTARVVEIDKTTGKILGDKTLGAPSGGAWAIAQYWGSFYVFSAATGGHSRVTKLDGKTGATETISDDVGFAVTGAGVSTCAPTGTLP